MTGTINFLHDKFSPLHSRSDSLVGSGATLWPSEKIIGHVHVVSQQNPGDDPDHPLPSQIVHLRLMFAKTKQDSAFAPLSLLPLIRSVHGIPADAAVPQECTFRSS
jgi:hypothetical protein